MSLDLVSLPPPGGMLADVYEEALDEATWFCELMDGAFDDAEHTLVSLAGGPEHALLGALEVLVVDAADRTSLRAVLDAPTSRYQFQVAVMAMLRLGELDTALEATQQSDPDLRAGAIRGCALLRDQHVLARAQRELAGELTARAAPWLQLLAAYGSPHPNLGSAFDLDERTCMVAALQIAAATDPRPLSAWLEWLLRYPDEVVHEHALRAALLAHSAPAWEACRAEALHEGVANPLAIQLFASLGGAAVWTTLEPLLSSPPHRDHVLFALGACGGSVVVPALLRQMEAAGRSAKVAFEAFSTITGLDTADLSFARNEDLDVDPHEAESDSADDDTAHEAADDLLAPDAEAVSRWWSERAAAFTPGVRWLGGRPFELRTARAFLLSAPLRRRHAIADLLRTHARGQLALDTRARPAWQQAQLVSWGSVRLHDPYGPG